jgi:hypothetical protein
MAADKVPKFGLMGSPGLGGLHDVALSDSQHSFNDPGLIPCPFLRLKPEEWTGPGQRLVLRRVVSLDARNSVRKRIAKIEGKRGMASCP